MSGYASNHIDFHLKRNTSTSKISAINRNAYASTFIFLLIILFPPYKKNYKKGIKHASLHFFSPSTALRNKNAY